MGHFLYVHVPFCEQKCTYCDFFTITDSERKHPLAAGWLELCARELELWGEAGDFDAAQSIRTIFLGGGTPSLLSPESVHRLCSRLKDAAGFFPGVEITLETQPGTVDRQRLLEYARAGVNRFSIGVQTFDPAILEATGRRHTVSQSIDTISWARETGQVVSVDMICAWPNQTLEQWQSELARAASFEPDHISVYELTFHEGTRLTRDQRKGAVAELDEEVRVAMFEHTRRYLNSMGFEHYEISNYARPDARSVHNQNYWRLGNYIGLGAGAHSLIFPKRFQNPNSATDYAKSIQSGKLFRKPCDTSDPDIFFAENLFSALRITEGAEIEALEDKLGEQALQSRAIRLEELQAAKLLELSEGRLRLTPTGQLQADAIISHLL